MSANDDGNATERDQAEGAPKRRSGGRVVVTWLFGVFGVLIIVTNIILLAMRIYRSDGIAWHRIPWQFRFWEIELRLVAMLTGAAFLAAAFLLARRGWRSGLILAASAWVVVLVNPAVNDTLRHHIAGDSYTVRTVLGETIVEDLSQHETKSYPDGPELLSAPFGEDGAKMSRDAWAEYLAQEPFETNSIGMLLVLVPPGAFQLGSSDSLEELERIYPIIEYNAKDAWFRNVVNSERPQHRVRITNPFYMGQCNVTVAQFQQFVDSTGYRTEAETDGKGASGYAKGEQPLFTIKPSFDWRNTGFPQQDNSPVVNVSWNDAMSFCRWLSEKEGKTYRLPTNAEWEYACRAGTTTRYRTSQNVDDLLTSENVADVAYYKVILGEQYSSERLDGFRTSGMSVNGDDHYAFTSPTCQFTPNAFGLYDLHGNASTWCMDRYIGNYYTLRETDNPPGPPLGSTRIVRGGNWQFYPAFCRSASRFHYAPSQREPFLGFRAVCEVP